jgi:cysteinyl-tRNA synthetase
MPLRLFNTRTRSVEPFAPLRDGHVRMYVCGLTPSAEAHLGHARSFLFFDVLRRYLAHPRNGWRVTYVRNVTDVDDRSINASKATGVPFEQIVQGYFASFTSSMQALHVDAPDAEPRATGYIAEILAMIERLIAIDAAYVSADGVYFAVRSFPRYGALARKDLDELEVGARIAVDEQKRDPLDFALWKFAKEGEPAWPSPYGDGRPGWHIECSAMAHGLLGEPFDIHGGGYDLIFPHHENEIAQTESLIDGRMANVWVHGGLLMFDGKKMSKSLGNFEPLSAVVQRLDPLAIRLLFLQTGYRKPMNFTEDAMNGANSALEKLRKTYHALAKRGGATGGADAALDALRGRFFDALDDDMNTAGAVGVLFDLVAHAPTLADPAAAAAFLREALTLFGIGSVVERPEPAAAERRALPPATIARLVEALGEAAPANGSAADAELVMAAVIAARDAARKAKDWSTADRIRNVLGAEKIALKDSPDGTTWTNDA